MNKPILEILKQDCLFQTKRLTIRNWTFLEQTTRNKNNLVKDVVKIMTPNVTKDLPDGWQNLTNINRAKKWVSERKTDTNFYAIQLLGSYEIIGFLFLYTENESTEFFDLRLGYLLTESIWGKGIGSELVAGLVNWCKKEKSISSIAGGVENNNIGSIRVLEKNGFIKTYEELPENMLLYKIEFRK